MQFFTRIFRAKNTFAEHILIKVHEPFSEWIKNVQSWLIVKKSPIYYRHKIFHNIHELFLFLVMVLKDVNVVMPEH